MKKMKTMVALEVLRRQHLPQRMHSNSYANSKKQPGNYRIKICKKHCESLKKLIVQRRRPS